MDYEDQIAIGAIFNTAIQRVLAQYAISSYVQPGLISALAQELLVELMRGGYKIEKNK